MAEQPTSDPVPPVAEHHEPPQAHHDAPVTEEKHEPHVQASEPAAPEAQSLPAHEPQVQHAEDKHEPHAEVSQPTTHEPVATPLPTQENAAQEPSTHQPEQVHQEVPSEQPHQEVQPPQVHAQAEEAQPLLPQQAQETHPQQAQTQEIQHHQAPPQEVHSEEAPPQVNAQAVEAQSQQVQETQPQQVQPQETQSQAAAQEVHSQQAPPQVHAQETQPHQVQPQEIQPQQVQQTPQPQAAQPSSSSGQQGVPKIYITPDAERPIELAETGFGAKQPTTVIEVFKATATKYTEQYALSVKRDGTWKHWNWGQYYNDAVQFARALLHLKFQPAQTVSILGFNSPEWFIANVGAIAAGGLAAGIYTTNGPEACAYIIGHSKSSVVVVENEAQLKKILQVKEKLPSVQAIVQWSGVVPADMPNLVYSWEAFLALGNNVNVAEVDARIADLKPGRACTLIYTSGTTGPPKAVMLSHDNLTYNAAACATLLRCNHEEHAVSYLPLSHIAAQIVDIHGFMFVGGHVWFAQPDALKGSLGDTLKEVRPTLFFGVPRVWEKIQEKMVQMGKHNGTMKKKFVNWARGVGLKGGKARQHKQGTPWGWTIAQKMVFDKVRQGLGLDRARFLATAAAPMPEETAEFFLSLNVTICDVYGMSEVSGPTTITPTETFRPGSIGKPVPGISVRIENPDENGSGEICWKGRSSFLGYMYSEKETIETFDAQGWLHTGDIGRLDKDGYLYITGRIKELIITAGGENISPSLIEDALKLEVGSVISNIMVVGDKRKFLACLLTLRVDPLPDAPEGQYSLSENLNRDALAVLHGIGSNAKTVQEAKQDPALKKWILDGITRYNKHAVSSAQQIRTFFILDHDFTIDNETLTPTMKLKRRIVLQRYAKEIDEMYAIAEKEFEGKA